MLLSLFVLSLVARFIPDDYACSSTYRVVSIVVGVVYAILSALYFRVYLGEHNFRAWLCIICFYAGVKAILGL